MFKLDFEWRRWLSMMLVGLIQYAEGLEKKTDLSEEEGILPADEFCLWTQITALFLPWVSSLRACLREFGLASLNNYMSQFLKINLSLHICAYSTGSVSLENPNIIYIFFEQQRIKGNLFYFILQPKMHLAQKKKKKILINRVRYQSVVYSISEECRYLNSFLH